MGGGRYIQVSYTVGKFIIFQVQQRNSHINQTIWNKIMKQIDTLFKKSLTHFHTGSMLVCSDDERRRTSGNNRRFISKSDDPKKYVGHNFRRPAKTTFKSYLINSAGSRRPNLVATSPIVFCKSSHVYKPFGIEQKEIIFDERTLQ